MGRTYVSTSFFLSNSGYVLQNTIKDLHVLYIQWEIPTVLVTELPCSG